MKFTHRSIPFHLAFPCTVDIESEQGILCCVKFIRCPRRFRPTGSNVACVAGVFFFSVIFTVIFIMVRTILKRS